MPSRNRQTALLTVGGLSLLLAARAAVRKWREYSLQDRVVLITGGSRGLGLVLARDMLRQIETSRIVRCDEAAWRFLGLSLAGYNVLISLLMAVMAVWGIVSAKKRA